MEFQTKIPLVKQAHNHIDYSSKILLLGSCFAENIGEKLEYFKFQKTVNPFGILFHPKAIETCIANAINDKIFSKDDLFLHNERWHCFDAHSKLSNPDREVLVTDLNANVKQINQQIKAATHIIITLGTSWVYRFMESDRVVANCHKVPQKKFLKELLSVDDVVESLEAIVELVKLENPQASIIFTVSPIRHAKDGFVENNLSKSHLISGIHQILNERLNVFYFPSYEIMMDELRDYRFYGEDMLHPNQTAINYIWEGFKDVWVSEPAKRTMNQVETIQKGLSHRPFNKNSEQHEEFLKKLKQKQSLIKKEFPHIMF